MTKNGMKSEAWGSEATDAKFVTMEVAKGEDMMEHIVEYGVRENVNVTIINGSGSIGSATLRQGSGGSASVTVHGPFSLVSFSGTYLCNNHYTLHAGASPPPSFTFGITLRSSHGNLLGGAVAGKVIAAHNVTLIAFTYSNPHVYKCNPDEAYTHHHNNDAASGSLSAS
ncbi:hypothetical protein Fmac_026765 [Flemingia macrophylla]|uniref:PPC domain-containing protein n=1 Tax=Flemingia macrophylla TaxID=520843 RepID=A0ABD1LG01_9FABA